MAHSPPHDPEDDHDDLAALEFFTPDVDLSVPVIDAFGDYVVDDDSTTSDLLDALDPLPYEEAAEQPSVPLFTVTNPPGTVTVTTFMDGRVNRIDLSPKATTMTESNLADEIVVIARLATQDARSAQYSFMLEGMREQGHDNAATHDFLTRDLDLPSPDQAQAARAQVFATRYASNHD